MAEVDHGSVLWHIAVAISFASGLLLLASAHTAVLVCVFLFILVPLIFRYSYTLQRSMMFLNFVRYPRNFNFSNPEKVGLLGVRNFYLTTDKNIKLGVWQILPSSLINDSKIGDANEDWYASKLKDGKPIILYMHGNSGSRAAGHRVELYKVLRKLDFHVVAFDYRSYADSSPLEPSEGGLVEDGVFMYKWLEKQSEGKSDFCLGSFLGNWGTESYGLVLEAAFNNMRDELRGHALAQVWRFLPWFDSCFVWPLYENGLKFDSDENLSKTLAPVLLLHAKDDRIVPFYLGEKLYEILQKKRSNHSLGVEFFGFDAKHDYGHKYIYKEPSLPDILKNFVQSSIKKRSQLLDSKN